MVNRIALMMTLLISTSMPLQAGERPHLKAALEAAAWIRASAVKTDEGIIWPSDPRDPKTISTDLYSGTPGVVLFFLEAYRSTGDRTFLTDARGGSDYLLAQVRKDAAKEKGSGLYVGIAGIGFTLAETFKATGEKKYRDGALHCVQLLRERATKAGNGIEWSDTTDIIGGSAGTGLFLLYVARELKESAARELAILAGRRLVDLGRPEGGGLKWAMDSKFPRLMPNFSHGTAGIAYFLATLYKDTKQRAFLDAALAGARYLQSVALTDGDACLIFHHEPGGKDLYYLGWCHGPAGTARLFYRLYQVTSDKSWMGWVQKAARADITSGIPEKQTPGFWNNVSQCCGSAGVAEFMLDLYRVTRDRSYSDFARRMTANLLARATREGNGMKWIQAEHRVQADLLVAQTGYMQGAAGIGMWLLHLDGFEQGRAAGITFPDSPFVDGTGKAH
jgi:lantibiotic modifying enzyme